MKEERKEARQKPTKRETPHARTLKTEEAGAEEDEELPAEAEEEDAGEERMRRNQESLQKSTRERE